jgi:hypothetical protein
MPPAAARVKTADFCAVLHLRFCRVKKKDTAPAKFSIDVARVSIIARFSLMFLLSPEAAAGIWLQVPVREVIPVDTNTSKPAAAGTSHPFRRFNNRNLNNGTPARGKRFKQTADNAPHQAVSAESPGGFRTRRDPNGVGKRCATSGG